MTLRELIGAWLAIPGQRRDQIREQAMAARVAANANKTQFGDFLRQLTD